MKHWIIVASTGLGLASLILGCGNESTGPEPTGGAGGTSTGSSGPCTEERNSPGCLSLLDAASAELAAAACADYFQCHPVLAALEEDSVDTCTTRWTELYKNLARLDGAAMLPEDMQACADLRAQPDCGSSYANACAFPGKKDLGEQCGADAECKSLRCVGFSGSVCGVCQAARPEGQSCAPDDHDCAWGLVCVSSTHTCEPFRTEGEPCSEHRECYGTLICLDGKCSKALGEGESCGQEAICDPDQSLACLPSFTCGKFGIVGVGESCADAVCEYGAVCSGQLTCAPRPLEGQACGSLPCISPAHCVGGLCTLDYAHCP